MDPTHWGLLLTDEVERCLPDWVRRCIETRLGFRQSVDPEVIAQAGADAVSALIPGLRALLSADVDAQRGTPLTLIRAVVRYPTEVLQSVAAPEVARDPFAVNAFPDDVFDLSPGNWADIHEDLADPGLRWSVAKAFEYKRRHANPRPTSPTSPTSH